MIKKTTAKVKKSAIPIYIAGLIWIILACFLKMIQLSDYLICIGISLLGYVLSEKFIFKPEVIEETIEVAQTPQEAANLELQKQRSTILAQLCEYDEKIADEDVSIQIRRIEKAVDIIFDTLNEQPMAINKARKLFSYYLPTLFKLFDSYDKLEDITNKGEQVSKTITQIEHAAHIGAEAIEKQADLLYSDQAMDISSDVEVLETLMKQQGLLDEKIK